jgi:transposase-like protein
VQGVSTRKVRAVTEELCGHGFSASALPSVTVQLDAELERFMRRPLTEEYAYLILDARYERVREGGVIRSGAVLVAIGIDWEGRRQVLAVELANRESPTGWRDFLIGLKQRGLAGVHLVVTDDHEGLNKRSPKSCPRRCGNAATCTSCAMRSIICPVPPTGRACRNCVGCTTGATPPKRVPI